MEFSESWLKGDIPPMAVNWFAVRKAREVFDSEAQARKVWRMLDRAFHEWKTVHGVSPTLRKKGSILTGFITRSFVCDEAFESAAPYLCAGLPISSNAALLTKLIHDEFISISALRGDASPARCFAAILLCEVAEGREQEARAAEPLMFASLDTQYMNAWNHFAPFVKQGEQSNRARKIGGSAPRKTAENKRREVLELYRRLRANGYKGRSIAPLITKRCGMKGINITERHVRRILQQENFPDMD